MSLRSSSQLLTIEYQCRANFFQKSQDISNILNVGYSNKILDIYANMLLESNALFMLSSQIATEDQKNTAADYIISNGFNRTGPDGYVQNNYWE
jgi:hypothetical protein